jgi:hypothetical protein
MDRRGKIGIGVLCKQIPETEQPFEIDPSNCLDFTQWQDTLSYQRQLVELLLMIPTACRQK